MAAGFASVGCGGVYGTDQLGRPLLFKMEFNQVPKHVRERSRRPSDGGEALRQYMQEGRDHDVRVTRQLAQLRHRPRASYQRDLVARYESGELLEEMNNAVVAWGHGTLQSPDGQILPIGGSTVGGSRRLCGGWIPPNVEEFLRNCGDPPWAW